MRTWEQQPALPRYNALRATSSPLHAAHEHAHAAHEQARVRVHKHANMHAFCELCYKRDYDRTGAE